MLARFNHWAFEILLTSLSSHKTIRLNDDSIAPLTFAMPNNEIHEIQSITPSTSVNVHANKQPIQITSNRILTFETQESMSTIHPFTPSTQTTAAPYVSLPPKGSASRYSGPGSHQDTSHSALRYNVDATKPISAHSFVLA